MGRARSYRPTFPAGSRRLAAVPVVACLALGLVSCSNADAEGGAKITLTTTVPYSPTPEQAPPASPPERTRAQEAPEERWKENYQQVIADPSQFPVTAPARYEPDGTYSYALVEATSDSSPELLLRTNSAEFSPVTVFTTDQSSSELVQSEDVLLAGAASAGGSRTQVAASRAGDGLYQFDYLSTRPIGQTTLYGLDGTALTEIGSPTDFPWQEPLPDHLEIQWRDSTDPSGLDALPGSEPAPAEKPAQQADDGLHNFTGTVIEKSTSEVMSGRPSPNGEPASNRYLILALDQPMKITATKAGDSHSELVSEISPGERSGNEWASYLGTQVVVNALPEQVSFPSDTSLPLGMLRLGSYESVAQK